MPGVTDLTNPRWIYYYWTILTWTRGSIIRKMLYYKWKDTGFTEHMLPKFVPEMIHVDGRGSRFPGELQYHGGWTPFFFMYDRKCSTTFPWCTIYAPVTFAWYMINLPAAFAWCTNHFVHKVEFSYIGTNRVHPLWIYPKAFEWRHMNTMASPVIVNSSVFFNSLFRLTTKGKDQSSTSLALHSKESHKSTKDGWFLPREGRLCGKCFHHMTSSRNCTGFPWSIGSVTKSAPHLQGTKWPCSTISRSIIIKICTTPTPPFGGSIHPQFKMAAWNIWNACYRQGSPNHLEPSTPQREASSIYWLFQGQT